MPQPIDLPLSFEGHPDQTEPAEPANLFGIRIVTPFEFAEVGDWPSEVKTIREKEKRP